MSLDPLLLQMLGNSNQTSPGALLNLLQSQESLSPRAQMLLQIMSQQQQADDDEDDVIDIEAGASEQRTHRKIRELQTELDEAREMIDVLAEAIGACPDCFGGDDDCPVCHGHGTAGWQLPERELFAHFIVPAIRRFKSSSYQHESAHTVVHDSSDMDDVPTNPTSAMQKGDYDV